MISRQRSSGLSGSTDQFWLEAKRKAYYELRDLSKSPGVALVKRYFYACYSPTTTGIRVAFDGIGRQGSHVQQFVVIRLCDSRIDVQVVDNVQLIMPPTDVKVITIDFARLLSTHHLSSCFACSGVTCVGSTLLSWNCERGEQCPRVDED